jgi:glycosyltransferase involved in cell wall biosynthesis
MRCLPEVEVLLATYNGERFLRQQIDSILEQDYSGLRILARDDGSSDGTLAILEEYAASHPDKFQLIPTDVPSRSPKGNFLRLMHASQAPYVMFADQDDVWHTDKVSSTLALMRQLVAQYGSDVPLLVFTDLVVVDENLTVRHESLWHLFRIDPSRIADLGRLLRQNVATGSTMMLNRPLLQLALNMPEHAFMHDWWVALLASALGHAAYLNRPTVQYRQHGSNVLGAVEPERPNLIPRLRHHDNRRAEWELYWNQAKALFSLHGDSMSKANREIAEAFVRCGESGSPVERVFTMLRYQFFVKNLRSNLAILWYLWDMEAARESTSR